MNEQELIKRCFVIGPMKDMSRLSLLARKIVEPLVRPHGFTVITPEEGNIGSVMDQVLLYLEQADILVADLTGNNPNVMYELGIYHSFGKPSLIVKDSSYANEQEQTPFDIAAYRFLDLPLEDIESSRALLKPRLEEIIRVLGEIDWFPNPVTRFYNSPIAEIPTAVGLSKNYLKNFLSMILPKVFMRYEDSDDFELKVYEVIGKDTNGNPIERQLEKSQREKLQFKILIPDKMHMANHDYIRNLQEGKLIDFVAAKVVRRSRPFNLYMRYDDSGTPVLIDIPTVLVTLNDSIQRRRGLQETQIDNSEWLLLETQELERFASKCELFRKKLETEYPSTKNKIQIVWRWSPDENLD
ncbi:hypothetical protein SAMN04488057_10590 [Cyclobacterium lianum]|uniref:Prokaryotic STING domain-containing protein n=1 Tax=Cyclobacterium lianum TaxID=388280 RepID=A0A1M7N670_9BACT|nr:STING domain-containing protein [Cyclobacterium lianum]SHM99106.1 hypothetical protein SAMN04488057_10590 [Cyclobacterium lianum]